MCVVYLCTCFFFFKQKTAYEMRISDWSSDVCSSDLTLDLRQPEGQEVVRKLAETADVLIENFRPGTLEGWGLGWDVLHEINPQLIMLRVSGYGQTGPYRDRPGRSEEHTSELQSLMRISYDVFCLKKTLSDTAQQYTYS